MVLMEYTRYDSESGIAYYACYPEGKTENRFEIGIDPVRMTVEYNSLGEQTAYSAHAAWRLFDIIKETNELPQKAASAWY